MMGILLKAQLYSFSYRKALSGPQLSLKFTDSGVKTIKMFADLGKSAQMLQNSEKSGPVLHRVGVEVALFPGHR